MRTESSSDLSYTDKLWQAADKLCGQVDSADHKHVVLVEMLEPYEGRIYDPVCGSGGMLTQAKRFVEAHGGNRKNVSIFGQESNHTPWRLAHMNLAIHSIKANLSSRPADTFLQSSTRTSRPTSSSPTRRSNVSDWDCKLLENDARWQFGTPPNGTGGGMAGFVMANGSLSSTSGGEGEIRRDIVEADLVDCIVALPAHFFFTNEYQRSAH